MRQERPLCRSRAKLGGMPGNYEIILENMLKDQEGIAHFQYQLLGNQVVGFSPDCGSCGISRVSIFKLTGYILAIACQGLSDKESANKL